MSKPKLVMLSIEESDRLRARVKELEDELAGVRKQGDQYYFREKLKLQEELIAWDRKVDKLEAVREAFEEFLKYEPSIVTDSTRCQKAFVAAKEALEKCRE